MQEKKGSEKREVLLISFSISARFVFAIIMEYKKNSIKLDDGTDRKPQTVKGTDGKDLKFNSLIGALNYMSLQGWELVDTKSVTTGGGFVGAYGGASSTSTTVYYIFCKEVPDEELEETVANSYRKD